MAFHYGFHSSDMHSKCLKCFLEGTWLYSEVMRVLHTLFSFLIAREQMCKINLKSVL